jgi:hypothetical protein
MTLSLRVKEGRYDIVGVKPKVMLLEDRPTPPIRKALVVPAKHLVVPRSQVRPPNSTTGCSGRATIRKIATAGLAHAPRLGRSFRYSARVRFRLEFFCCNLFADNSERILKCRPQCYRSPRFFPCRGAG